MRYIDFHCDTLSRLVPREPGMPELPLRSNNGQVDAERLRASGCAAQFFAMFMAITREPDPLKKCLTMVEKFHRELDACSDLIAFAGNADDLDRNLAAGKTSAFLTIEDSGIIGGDITMLRVLYRLGLRLITLTWNFDNTVGSPNNTPEATAKGLTENGIEFVRECNRLGVIVDVSHLSDAGFWDVVKYSEKPFVASHSDARAVSSHSRNLTDEMIRALADKGGCMGVNFAPSFLTMDLERNDSTIEMLVAQIQHMVKTGGIECAAVGTDFDGIGGELEINSADKMPLLFAALEKAGFKSGEIEKIAHGNVERVLREAL